MSETVLISGVSGFLGSHLAEMCLSQDWQVLGLVRPQSDLWRLKDLTDHPRLKLLQASELAGAFEQYRPNIIIHTATVYGRLGESLEEMKQAHIELPLQLLELGKKSGAAVFLNTDTFMPASTSLEDRYYNYCQTKKEFVRQARENLANVKFLNLKVYHMYGPKDNPTKFLSWVINQMLQAEEEIPLTAGDQSRDFIYISDVVSAFAAAIKQAGNFASFTELEVGTGREYFLKDAVELLKKYLHSGSRLVWGAKPHQPGEIMKSKADLSRNGDFDWQAKVSLEQGLQLTAQYYLQTALVL